MSNTPKVWTMTMIAEHVGFGSRTSLFRHLKAGRVERFSAAR